MRSCSTREEGIRTLRCFATQSNETWEAICLDLDIAAQGISFEDADHNLRDAVAMYVEYIDTLSIEERKNFLRRRVPLATRIRFAMDAALSTLGNHSGQERYQYYRIPFPS